MAPNLRRFISDNLKYYRKAKGLTQEEFADKMGIKRTTYANKEKAGDFITEEIIRAEKLLGIPKNSLATDLGHSGKKVQIDDVAATLLQNNIEMIALLRVNLGIMAEMNAPGLKTSSVALSDTYRKMVKDEAERVADEIQKR